MHQIIFAASETGSVSSGGTIAFVVFVLIAVAIVKYIRMVPQQEAYVVERLGKYRSTLKAGLHFLLPIIDRIAYKHTLKEQAIDVPPQSCITKDNITVEVDGILYLQVVDPSRASYGISNYLFATVQLAQTTMRSEMGKLDLDKSFEEREHINGSIVEAIDKASEPWGVKVTRYEIKNITPPQTIRDAMEKQMRAEREKRAQIAESEGSRQAKINIAEGERQQAIALSEGEKMKRINEADGHAQEIKLVADANAYQIQEVAKAQAESLRKIAAAINENGGVNAVNMQLAQQYLGEFGKLAKTGNTMIIPSDLANVAGIVKAITNVVKQV